MTVEKRGNEYCTIHCAGKDVGKPIKCFPTKEEADAQHRSFYVKKVEVNLKDLL